MQTFKIKINEKWLVGFQNPNTRTGGCPDPDLIVLNKDEEKAKLFEGAFNVGSAFNDIVLNMRYYKNVTKLELIEVN